MTINTTKGDLVVVVEKEGKMLRALIKVEATEASYIRSRGSSNSVAAAVVKQRERGRGFFWICEKEWLIASVSMESRGLYESWTHRLDSSEQRKCR